MIAVLGWQSGQSQQSVKLSPERATQVRILVPAPRSLIVLHNSLPPPLATADAGQAG